MRWPKPFQDGAVAATFSAYPEPVRSCLLELRELILQTAEQTQGVGAIQETLKWGQPAYLTPETKSGSTLRIDALKNTPDGYAMYFHCQTNLVESFRERFQDTLPLREEPRHSPDRRETPSQSRPRAVHRRHAHLSPQQAGPRDLTATTLDAAYHQKTPEVLVRYTARALESLASSVESLEGQAPRKEIAAGVAREHFRPLEEIALVSWWSRFLTVRDALWETLSDTAANAPDPAFQFESDWSVAEHIKTDEDYQLFLLGYTAASLIVRLDRLLVEDLATHKTTQRKLNEGFLEHRIPAPSSTPQSTSRSRSHGPH